MIKQPFSNVQLELLKVFNANLSDAELIEFKKMLADYFYKRTVDAADKVWDEKGWTNEDVDRMLNTKMRSSKPK